MRDIVKFEEKKNGILHNALSLFAAKGYDGVSVQEIATAAMITKSTIYYYYVNKEQLYRAVWETQIISLFDDLKEHAVYIPNTAQYDMDVYPVLKRIVLLYFEFAAKHKTFYALLLSHTYAPVSAEATEIASVYYDKQFSFLEKLFAHMSNAHGNLYMKEKYLAVTFLAVINSWIGLWILKKAVLTEKDAEIIVKQFMHGIFS